MQTHSAPTIKRFALWPVYLAGGMLLVVIISWIMSNLIQPGTVSQAPQMITTIDFIKAPLTQESKDTQRKTLEDKLPEPQTRPKMSEPQTPAIEPLSLEHGIATEPTLAPPLTTPNFRKLHLEMPLSQPSSPPEAPANFDSNLYPLLTTDPIYPRRAKRGRIEGWVNVAFTINISGAVEDVEILAAEPEGVFENATLSAIPNWRFQPQLLNGVPTARRVVQTIKFELKQ